MVVTLEAPEVEDMEVVVGVNVIMEEMNLEMTSGEVEVVVQEDMIAPLLI